MSQGNSGTGRTRPEVDTTAFPLSAREVEILGRVAEGKTNAEISGILAISPFTVKNHVQSILRKLGVSNRTEAAVRYLQDDLRQMGGERAGRIAVSTDSRV